MGFTSSYTLQSVLTRWDANKIIVKWIIAIRQMHKIESDGIDI